MPVTPTYPGVYIEEIPSGVHTITGVPTSITAFLGRAVEGDTKNPVTINSWADFEREFGGLNRKYPMSYAVRDFYQNGGSVAIIVRLYKATDGKPPVTKINANGLPVQAASEGSWSGKLKVRIDTNVSSDVATQFGLDPARLFNLSVQDAATGSTEKFLNLTVDDSPNRVDIVLKETSSLLRIQPGALPKDPPAKDEDPDQGKSVWDDANSKKTFNKAADGDKGTDSAALTTQADFIGDQNAKTGMYLLEKADLFNLLCIPEDAFQTDLPAGVYSNALTYCVARRAMLVVDPPKTWTSSQVITPSNANVGLTGTAARNAALYFPRLHIPDPNLNGAIQTYVPCGAVAGVMGRTDTQRGVWKAPAGIDAALNGVVELDVSLTDGENGQLNPLGVNCLRTFPVYGSVVWGSRTLRGADIAADEYKYVPVRRMALYIEESLFRGTKWVVFEPNDEPLWAQIRLNIGAFMHDLFRKGAFQGQTPKEAYFVKCDKETTTQNDINLGIVNIVVGFAPLKPAEFVIIQIQQIVGDIQV
ncbi:MAG TPA: phage tail sheath subtilisin-like domain-containing protein [Candidatus Acidoferrum sp.]|nr:phage tail sheath subtilisin-like domain-containing protein [Candidatus Acidoferrum sp.]